MKGLDSAFLKNSFANKDEYIELFEESGYISNCSGSSKGNYEELSLGIEGMSLRILSPEYKKMVCTQYVSEASVHNLFKVLGNFNKSVNLKPDIPKNIINKQCDYLKEIYYEIDKLFRKYEIKHITSVLETNTSKCIYNNCETEPVFKQENEIFFSSTFLVKEKKRTFVETLSNKPFNKSLIKLEEDIIKYMSLYKDIVIPSGKYDVILAAGSTSVLFHECCGHTFEASKSKSPFYLCNMDETLASHKLTVIDDIFHLGNQSIHDDEGNKKSKTYILKEGKFQSLLTDRQTLYEADRYKPTGNCRRESYLYFPEPRMYCTYVDKGNDRIEEMFDSIKDGIFVKSLGEAYVNHNSGDFESMVQEGYVIKNGKIKEQIYGIKIAENAKTFLKNIQYISDDLKIVPSLCNSNSGLLYVEYGSPTICAKDLNFKY